MAESSLRAVLSAGVEAGASDWHIREASSVVLRVAGRLNEIEEFVPDHDFLHNLIQEICTPRELELFAEHGDCDFAHQEDGIGRFRVNLHRQRSLISLTFRHIKSKVPDFSGLGLPGVLQDIAAAERGIILVTGTTGSGKSTTLAAMLEYMNESFDKHIITIEDPIEYHFTDRCCIFEQREVGPDTSSFDSALMHALRQDPDTIVVGEMRHRHSFDTALTAADTGHMVMSTLHTSNAPQTIQRILDFYEESERKQVRLALAANLHAIISQRLVPKIAGGMAPATEILIKTPIIRKLLEEDKLDKLASAVEAGERDGMMSFNQCLLKLANDGIISEETALDKATNPEQLRMNLRGIFLNNSNAILG